MAIAYESAASASVAFGGTSGWTLGVNKPTGTVEGDLLLTFGFVYSSNSASKHFSTLSGWTQSGSDYNPDSLNGNAQLFYKVAGASEPSSYTWSCTSGFCGGALHCLRISGAEDPAVNAIDHGLSQNGTGSSTTAPSVTASDNDSLLLRHLSLNAHSVSVTTPTGFTLTTSQSNFSTQVFVKDALVASGATGTTAITVGSGTTWVHRSVTLAPASTGSVGKGLTQSNLLSRGRLVA